MREPFDPGFDFDRGTVAAVTATTILLCATVLFVVDRPAWMLPAAIVAGGVATALGGFYDASANNAILGVTLVAVPLYAFVFVYRIGGVPTPGTDPDLLFATAVYSMGDMLGYLPMMAVFAYLSATVTDRLRRRFEPPVGYPDRGEARRITGLEDETR
ncbi:hypothetical protein DM2_2112 [Halorubrum sp. DM2]|uniref:hypothetical protein n=1 Tax=unclassified Halorubrum TaxID=2642239 RepID=UPI0003DBA64A|nr:MULTISPECIES: hypothetical protein [unclassified Halorubrum]CDK38725.1 uncharacterized protein BN903_19 [Halorubrum sp. AJ67]VTT86074.1 hypothetical protein DM2_2112 [Halorubrum sp. DM2]